MRRTTLNRSAAVAAGLLLGVGPADAADPSVATTWDGCRVQDAATGEWHIDPACFLDAVVARYRGLTLYRDVASVTRVTRRAGERPREVRTLIGCEIRDGRLAVRTPASEARRGLGLDVPLRRSAAVDEARTRYDLWLAPHMALRLVEPRAEAFRAGVSEGLRPTEAEQVTVDDRELVHIELTGGELEPGDEPTRFDLWVNPDSMLVERMTGRQTLPDGAEYETSLEIRPTLVETLPTGSSETATTDDAPPPPADRAPPTSAPPASAPPTGTVLPPR